MRIPYYLLILLLLGLTHPATAETSIANLQQGNVVCSYQGQTARNLTRDGKNTDLVMAADGKTLAYIHKDAPATKSKPAVTSLWLADCQTGRTRLLFTSTYHHHPRHNMQSFHKPFFAANGQQVYVSAAAWQHSMAVHQINLHTGKEEYLIDGLLTEIVKSGKYQGYLLVKRQRVSPQDGNYEANFLVNPGSKLAMNIPGLGRWADTADITAWLQENGG